MKRKQIVAMQKQINKNRVWWVFLVVLVVVACVLISVFALDSGRGNKVLLTVDGTEIHEEVYRWAMFSARNDVLAEHTRNGISPVYWNTPTSLGMPYEMVAERAVEILRENYAVSSLAVERGYLEDASFEALSDQFKSENKDRAEAISAGKIITGLSGYDLNQYIQYRASALRRQYCDDDNNPEMNITEEEMRQRYDQDKDSLYVQEDKLDLRYIEVYTDSLELSEKKIAELEEEVDDLRQAAAEWGSLEEALEQVPSLQKYYQTATIDEESYAAYARSNEDLLYYAEDLQTGDLSKLINENGRIFLIECVKRVKNGYIPFETLTSVLKRSLQEQKYDVLIENRTTRIEAIYDAEKLYRYTAKQLG